jgi:hypothetical protein
MISPGDLQDHAASLIAARGSGARRQIELRRAISAAYYSLFHHFAQHASDLVIGRRQRNNPNYAIAYRSIQHSSLNHICEEAAKSTLKPQFRLNPTMTTFDPTIRGWSQAFQRLYRDRQQADYNPIRKFYQPDAEIAVSSAREAVEQFDLAPRLERERLLTLALFPGGSRSDARRIWPASIA